jgi:NAD(P)-dependent dehydrogenase (short-subunit alcohol dehydrogenase family)
MPLKDKVAIVTGAGSGIGRATAARLAQEGARLVLVDRDEAGGLATLSMLTTAGGDAHLVLADVSRAADTERMVDETVKTFGRLDALINNAAVMVQKAVPELSEEEWDHVLGVNLKSVFLCSKQAILCFRRQGGGGTITNIASVNSFYAEGGIAAYCASKGGVQQLTRAMAIDHSAEGIRINCVCPGWILRRPCGPSVRRHAARARANRSARRDRRGRRVPGKRRCIIRHRRVDRCGRRL